MNRIVFGLSIVAIVAIAAWAYGVNYRTGTKLREIDRLRAEITRTREDVQVLRVEWAFLNRPDRLRRLVELHHAELGLVDLQPESFGDLAAVPFPADEGLDPIEAALAAAASSILMQHAQAPEPVPSEMPGLLPVVEWPGPRGAMR